MPVNKKLTLLKTGQLFAIFNYIVSIFTLFISFCIHAPQTMVPWTFPVLLPEKTRLLHCSRLLLRKHSLSDLPPTGMLHLNADGWIHIYPFYMTIYSK